MGNSGPILQQFDRVQIITVKHVNYVSARPGTALSPHGEWIVVGILSNDAVLARDGILVKIPISDIRRTSTYNLGIVLGKVKNLIKNREQQ